MSSVNIQKFVTHCSIWLVFWGSLLLSLPGNNVLSAEENLSIAISSPEDYAILSNTYVEFTGRVVSSLTPLDQLNLQVFEQSAEGTLLEITNDGLVSITDSGEYSDWTFGKDFNEGIHTLSFIINDSSGNSASITKTFTISQSPVILQDDITEPAEQKELSEIAEPLVEEPSEANIETDEIINTGPRPTVVDIRIIPNDATDENDFLPAEDMTQVPLDAKLMLVVRATGNVKYTKPFIINKNNEPAIKSIEEDGEPPLIETKVSSLGFTEYYIPFTPAEALKPASTYYVFVNPMIKNDAGSSIFPQFFKFTTISNAHQDIPGDIHGGVEANTNTCAYCHSTHNGVGPSLDGGKYGQAAENYCMACHDGTVAPPMPDKYKATNKHYEAKEDTTKLNGCTSCHNPHLGWSKENPNKFKGYLEYTHQTEAVTPQTINSSDTLCETCHEYDDPNFAQVFSNDHYRNLSYSKSLATPEKFDLCLRCHNDKSESDITKYVNDRDSGHNILAQDGSSATGQMPCAECHETHGSDNMYQLKENLGHVKRLDGEKFIMAENKWSPLMEREFCLKCHNNKIEMFGKNASYSEKNILDESSEGHEPDSEQPCSECHGSGSDFEEQTRSAAHAPIKGANVKLPIPLRSSNE
jgi:hypothetical protein